MRNKHKHKDPSMKQCTSTREEGEANNTDRGEQSSDEGRLPETPSNSHGCARQRAQTAAHQPLKIHRIIHSDTQARKGHVCKQSDRAQRADAHVPRTTHLRCTRGRTERPAWRHTDLHSYLHVSSHHCLLSHFLFLSNSRRPSRPTFPSRETNLWPRHLQKSKVLAKTHVPFQNHVICYIVAQFRALYLSSDCHFSYISVIQLMYRGLGKRLSVTLWSCHRIPVSIFLACLLDSKDTHTSMHQPGPQHRVGSCVCVLGGGGVSATAEQDFESKVRERVIGANTASGRGGRKSVRERGGSWRKGRVKQQAKWERKAEGENLQSVFFAPAGQKVTAWRG